MTLSIIFKYIKLTVFISIFFVVFQAKAVTITDTAVANNVQVCLKPELVRLAFSVGGSGTTGSYLDIKLPTGFSWEGLAYGPIVTGGSGSNSITYVGLVGGKHRLTFGSSTSLQSIRLGFYQKAGCGAGTSSFTFRDSLFFYEGSGTINTSVTNLANGSAPSLSLTSISNIPAIAGVGVNVTRQFTVTNGGFGATSHFIIVDDYLNGAWDINNSSFFINPSGVNFNIPTSQISNNNDSVIIRFNATMIQQIGDGDTLFENGESFILNYTGVTLNCGDNSNNILSNLHTSWLCGGNVCTYSNTAVAISITVPNAPNIININKAAKTWCTNSNSVDTFMVINTGGTATNLIFHIASQSWPQNQNVGTNVYTGYLDTANFYVRLGKNGSLIHPNVTVTAQNSMNIYGTNWTNQPAVFRYNRNLLNTNDTLYFFVSQIYQTENLPCGSQSSFGTFRPGYPGILYDLNYKNACGNIDFDYPRTVVRAHEVQQIFWSENSQSDFYCDQSSEIIYKNEATVNQRRESGYFRFTNSYYDLEVTLPSALLFDNAFSAIQQVRYVYQNGTIIYPYFHPNSNTWRFKSTDLNGDIYGKWIVKVKGAPASSGVCTGVQTYNFSLYTLLDSLNCNPSGNRSRLICNNTNFTYYGCVICCPLGGLAVLNSSFQRTTIGLADNNNDRIADGTGKADTSLILRNMGIRGDSLRLMLKTVVITNATHPQWERASFGVVLPGISSFTNYEYLKSSVRIKYVSAGVDSVINVSSYSVLPGDSIIFNFTFSRPLTQNDTVILNASFRDMMSRTSLISHTVTPFYWASRNPNIGGGTILNNNRFWCGNTIKNYTHHATYNNGYNPGLMQFNACSQLTNISYFLNYVGNVNGHNTNLFQNEFRSIIRAERLATVFPQNYSIDSVNIEIALTTGNKRVYTVPYTMSGDSVIVNVEPYYSSGQLPLADETADVYVRFFMKPSCKVPSGITQVTSQKYYARFLPTNEIISDYVSSQAQLIYTAPTFILNSPSPVHLGYTKVANWPVTITNASTQTVPNVWMYISNNPNLPIDSIKIGASIFTPDGNGFFRLGTFTGNEAKNYTVFSKNLACQFDSVQVYMGYGCSGYPTAFTSDVCNFSPKYLYIQPQPAAIQTQVKALSLTPSDPSNSSSTAYGTNTIVMCQSFPFEMEIQSTQSGNIYDVKETISLPFNGGTALDYISDSGYIEYPIGTTPRLFSSAANTAILAQISSGNMTLDLAQIDPTNFGSDQGLLGTGLGNNNTRRVILRWKMKSNCDLISGEQWQPVQAANSPCSAPASGNNGVTSGFKLNLQGVSNPYVATVKIATGLDGCGEQFTQVRLEKTGGTPPQPTDSITIRLPKIVAAGSMICYGISCPGGTGSTQAYSIRTDALYQYLSFRYPNTASANGDTLLYQFPMRTINKSICENNQSVKADVFQQLTIYCGAPIPANLCPNAKSSLGSETKNFDIRKAILQFNNYYSEYAYQKPLYKYRFLGEVHNQSGVVDANTGVTLKTFMDVNNNLIYDRGTDVDVKTTVLGSSIPAGGFVSFYDSFSNPSFNPSPSVPMYTVIDTGDAAANCFCGGVVMSAFNQALPVQFLNAKANNILNKTAKVSWTISSETETERFNIYRRHETENRFVLVGSVYGRKNQIGAIDYVFLDDISKLNTGLIFYQIEAVSIQKDIQKSNVLSILKSESLVNGNLFNLQPNPANEQTQVFFNSDIKDATLKMMDMNGRVVFQQVINQNSININTQSLAVGIYTIQLETANGFETQKLSVVR